VIFVGVLAVNLRDALNIGELESAFLVECVVHQLALNQDFVGNILEAIMRPSMLDTYVRRLSISADLSTLR